MKLEEHKKEMEDKSGQQKILTFRDKIPSLRKKRTKMVQEKTDEKVENDFKINIYSGERDILEKTKKPRQQITEDKEYFRIFNYWRRYDLAATGFALCGLALALVNYEIDISNKDYVIYDVDVITTKYDDAMQTDRFKDGHSVLLRYFILITTALAIVCLVARHQYKIKWMNKYFNPALTREKRHADRSLNFYYNQAIVGDGDELMESKKDVLIKQKKLFNPNFCIECLILMVIPLPWYEHFFIMECINLNSTKR